MSWLSIYAGRRVAFLTQHGKEQVVAPVLEPGLGCVIEHVTGFDTDQLGTFTRDVPRPGSQLDAARRKARKGMELSGLSLSLASEGSFGPDPFSGMFPWNVELLVWLDDSLGIEVVGMAQGAARSSHLQSGDWVEVEAFAARVDFPSHQLVLRPQSQDDPCIHKGITDAGRLRACFDECLAQSSNRQVFVETDLRAFANPSRMKYIEQAARDLFQRIQSCCPSAEPQATGSPSDCQAFPVRTVAYRPPAPGQGRGQGVEGQGCVHPNARPEPDPLCRDGAGVPA